MKHLDFQTKIGILDPEGKELNPLTNEPYTQIYKDLAKIWSKFPGYSKAEDALKAIAEYQLIFIRSPTGGGKTALVPKFVLHFLNYQGKIAISLPKRIVTLSAAMFAAQTLDVLLGGHVGYVYKGSPKEMRRPENKLVYMTDGTLIMQFVKDPLLTEYNVIIIDEAHERKTQIDLLLLFLKKLLESGKRPDLKVIIMSATIDAKKYQDYFKGIPSTIVNISGKTNYEIEVHFLEKPAESYLIEGSNLIENLLKLDIKKDILFFITTSNEALQLCKPIRKNHPRIYCIEVYSDMPKEYKIYAESRDAYLDLGNYDLKLVMATNVAESSVTIDGLKYVIDSTYELFSYFDPESMGHILEKRLITKAQALQRRGRVGRTEPGICYHLLTEKEFNALNDYPTPDILKHDITTELLKIIQFTESKTYQEGYQYLTELMDVPSKPYIEMANDLYQLYQIIEPDGKFSKIGSTISKFSSLPINQSLFLAYAYELHCAKEASIIIAMIEILNGKLSNLFLKADTMCESDCFRPSAKNLIKKLVKKKGDHFTFLNIYQTYQQITDKIAWARKYGIRLDILKRTTEKFKYYYYRIINISKIPPERIKGSSRDSYIKNNLLEALKKSHQHLIAKKLIPVYPKKKHQAQIQKESSVYYYYDRKALSKKNFIYDELISINNSWEFSIVTLL